MREANFQISEQKNMKIAIKYKFENSGFSAWFIEPLLFDWKRNVKSRSGLFHSFRWQLQAQLLNDNVIESNREMPELNYHVSHCVNPFSNAY